MYAPARHPDPTARVAGALWRRPVLLLTLKLTLWLPMGVALAHDTWFAPLPAASGGTVLALGTGNRFPVQEFTMTMAQLQQSGCRVADEAALPLQHAGDTPTALRLRTPWARQDPRHLGVRAGYSCWAQSVPFEVELPADKVAIYLKEISASPAVRAAWADLQSRGLPWKERYTKHARIELAGPVPGTAQAAALPLASGMAMDVLLQGQRQPLRAGDELRAQVLRDGQPLADFALELLGDRSPLGFWQRTDAEGRVRFKLPLAGRWVLRGTDLRLSTGVPDTWESRFVTLAFEVAPKDAAVAVRTAAP